LAIYANFAQEKAVYALRCNSSRMCNEFIKSIWFSTILFCARVPNQKIIFNFTHWL